MEILLSVINALIFTVISGFHFYWAMDGKVGFDVVLPSNTEGAKALSPSKSITFIVACVFLGVAIFYLRHVEIINFPMNNTFDNYGLELLFIVLIIRAIGDFKYAGFFKKIKNTPFAHYDSTYYSPLCLFLALTTFAIEYFKMTRIAALFE
jgi:glucan phosphoethanolaminetransferase (alkaline phosphatase superfamily)